MRPEIFICTETHVSSSILDSEIAVSDVYNVIRSDATSRHSAGVVVYVKSNVTFNVVEDFIFGLNSVIVIDILNGLSRGRWFCVYHSPNSSHPEFLEIFDQILQRHLDTVLPIRITGDFNINMHRNSQIQTYKRQLNRLLIQNGLK